MQILTQQAIQRVIHPRMPSHSPMLLGCLFCFAVTPVVDMVGLDHPINQD
jgi:hypothetical protein